ncbi:MAG: WD40/YVTN/BNR-like repeat-containing protein, partial [Acidimicrobiales bacterium]
SRPAPASAVVALAGLAGLALLLAACGGPPVPVTVPPTTAPPTTVPSTPAGSAPTTTVASTGPRTTSAAPPPCPSGNGPGSGFGFTQSLDGTVNVCFRLPEYRPGAYTVSLGSFFFDTGPAASAPSAARAGDPGVAITLSPASGGPGTVVTIHGRFLGPPPAKRRNEARVCWDGCATGLVQEGAAIHYGSGGHFTTTLTVPETAWLTAGGPHALASGTYPVGIECLDATKGGCASQARTQGRASFTLHAPPPSRCVTGKPCAHLRLVPDHARPGQTVHLEGWAPVQVEIGAHPFAYQIDVRRGPAPAPGTVTRHTSPKGPSVTLSLAPATLHVEPLPSLASLGALHPTAVQLADPPAVASAPGDPRRLAYCTRTGLELSNDGGAHWSAVPTAGVSGALGAAGLALPPGWTPGCRQVVLGPPSPAFGGPAPPPGISPGTVYAAFLVQPGPTSDFPLVGMYTADGGRGWHLVPAPSGVDPRDFSGFHASGTGVTAEYAPGPGPGALGPPAVEATTDGGRNWSSVAFSCPGTGPCIRFGGHGLGNCAMNGKRVLVWSSADGGHHWTRLDQGVNACNGPELAALSPTEEVLLAPGSGYPVQVTRDGGGHWSAIGLPPAPGAVPAATSGYVQTLSPPRPFPGRVLDLLPRGQILLSPSSQPWLLLAPGANAWCHPPATPSSPALAFGGSPTVVGSGVWWLSPPSTNGAQPSPHHLPLSAFHC